MAKTVKTAAVKTATPEVIVQRHLDLGTVELSPEMKNIEKGGYDIGKVNFCGKEVHYAGSLSILTEKRFVSIGLSEGSHLDGINIAKRATASVAERGFANIIVGGTRPTEMHIIRECIESGGKVVVLLPMGIGYYGKKFATNEIKQFISDRNLILVSQFSESRAWDMETAKKRNTFLATVAGSLFIAECRGEKGVWGLAECFKTAKKAIYVPRLHEERKRNRIEHYGLVGALGAIQLEAEPVELSDGESDIYKIITRI